MIALKSHVAFIRVWQFLYSCCLKWIEEKAGSFWLGEGSASPSAAPQAPATVGIYPAVSQEFIPLSLQVLVIVVVDACSMPEAVWVSWANGSILVIVVLVVPTVVFITSTPQVCPVGDVIFKFLPGKKDSICFPAWNYSANVKQKWCKSLFQKFGFFADLS